MIKSPLWRVRHNRLTSPPLIFAIINLTPDSLFDGGKHYNQDNAMAQCEQLTSAGVQVLDLGAESTRPGALSVSPEDEWLRLEPVLKNLADLKNNASPLLSIDTYNASTAKKALDLGADIINDVSAFEFDSQLLPILFEYKPGYVLMHSKGSPKTMQNNPSYDNVVQEVKDFLAKKMEVLLAGGFPEENIILDPGIGFGKTLEHNLALLQNLDSFKELGRPLFIGLSNKALFGDLLGLKVDQRATATQVAVALLAQHDVYAHRVHDGITTLATLKLVQGLCPSAAASLPNRPKAAARICA